MKNNNQPLKIGITGGIGSGKTTVCHIFENLGIPVYYSDERAKELMTENEKVRHAVELAFGKEAYFPDRKLDRSHLAKIVFGDKKKLDILNAIVHPAVFLDADNWHQSHVGSPYTLREAALLVETKSYLGMDKLIVVAAPQQIRIQRVMKRDRVGEQDVKDRIAKQLPDAMKIQKADFILNNDGLHPLLPQVTDIHQSLLKMLGRRT